MREIKFRAWDKENEVMADVDFFSKSVIGIKNAEFEDIENFILLQFTGLLDKNGMPIYEGDIVTGKRDSHWHEGYSKVKGKVHYSEYTLMFLVDGIGAGALYKVEDLEVIGNIYEHSHLLKEEVK